MPYFVSLSIAQYYIQLWFIAMINKKYILNCTVTSAIYHYVNTGLQDIGYMITEVHTFSGVMFLKCIKCSHIFIPVKHSWPKISLFFYLAQLTLH